MLFKKVKKDYIAASHCDIRNGDIVKYSTSPRPLSGSAYFVVNMEDSILYLKNMTSLRVVRYDLNSNKFLF